MRNKGGLNRRELLLAAPALIILPRLAYATIPPPPASLWYLLFIADGIYKISNLLIIDLPPDAGTCQNYTASDVTIGFSRHLTYTKLTGISTWHLMTGAPYFRWWEYYDRRNQRYVRLYQGDKIEARFADKSRVTVIFRGPNAVIPFEPLRGTERLPNGALLNPPDRRGTLGGDGKGRDESGGFVTKITPSIATFKWSYSTQETPW